MKRNRQYAIGDIHGCLKTFKEVLYQKIQLKKEDQIFLLGDYVNRGPDSLGVLDEIIQLKENGYKIHALKGNHEVMFLENELMISDTHRNFLQELPFFFETSEFYFVHAELNFSLEDPLEGTSSMIWGVGYPVEPDLEFLNKRKVIHGHEIHSLSSIFDAIVDDDPIIPLDNGCYKGLDQAAIGFGNLCALDLRTMKLLVQENIDEGNGKA